ncbi:MAG: VCBS domain-containing protein, partial [Myxococcales bacterium]|nr:VCBS domain-containing protein [Myxococcales bacterium]
FEVTAVNDLPRWVTSSDFVVSEGGEVALSGADLEASDVEDDASTLSFVVVAEPTRGVLELDGSVLSMGDSFTQAQLLDGLVLYVHDGSESTEDAFSLDLRDSSDSAGATREIGVAVQPSNDDPTLVSGWPLIVTEGGTAVLSQSNLAASDNDDSPSALRFTVEAQGTEGALFKGNRAMSVGESFSQADINAGRISYRHEGGESQTDTFEVSLSDGESEPITEIGSVQVTPVNDPPTLSGTLVLVVNEGESVVLDGQLDASDSDDSSDDVLFSILSGPAHGAIQAPGEALTFTLTQLNAGEVSYLHDGSETTQDSFVVRVSDDDGASSESAQVRITINPVNDAPVLVNSNVLELNEGIRAFLTENTLLVTDADNSASQLIFSVTAANMPQNGELRVDGVPVGPGDVFTQADILNHRVSYEHDGGESGGDTAVLRVRDTGTPVRSLDVIVFQVDIAGVNDPPVLVANNGVSLDEGADVLISGGELLASDVDDDASEVHFIIVEAPEHGQFWADETALEEGEFFSLEDILTGALRYVHDGSESASDSATLKLEDSFGAGPPAFSFEITITTENDPPVLLVSSGATIDENDVFDFSTDVLSASDEEQSNSEILFVITSTPTHGDLVVGETTLDTDDSFSQAQLEAGSVRYVHNGDEDESDSFFFRVTDGTTTLDGEAFEFA